MMADRPSLLSNVSLFAGCSAEALSDIEAQAQLRDYPQHGVLARAGEPADKIFVLHKGAVRVFRSQPDGSEITVMLFGAPAIFGEMETFMRVAFVNSMVAIRAVGALVFSYDAFTRIVERHPGLTLPLLTDICHRLYVANNAIAQVAFHDVQQRVAQLLLSYANVLGVRVADGVQIVTDTLTQRALARGVAATRKSVQRTFNRWAESGVVSRRGRYYVVHDMDRLSALAGEPSLRIDHTLGGMPKR